jgi:hypothetical protein
MESVRTFQTVSEEVFSETGLPAFTIFGNPHVARSRPDTVRVLGAKDVC